jgi:hypothetical protein
MRDGAVSVGNAAFLGGGASRVNWGEPGNSCPINHTRPTEGGAFILPSVGRVASAPRLTVQRPPTFEIMRTRLKPVIAASAQAICARTDHRQAIVWSSDVRPTRSTLATDLHPRRPSWCWSIHGRTASTSAEMHSTSLAADHQEHPGITWKRADQQRPRAPTHLIRHQCCPACRSWMRRRSPPTSPPHPRTYYLDGPTSHDTQQWHNGPDRP